MGGVTFTFPSYRRWYRYGWRSPRILVARLRNKHQPIFRLRMAWQRARDGYSTDQFWNLNYALAKLTVEGVKRLREWETGYPGAFTDDYGDGGGWEAWDAILARIQTGFEAWLEHDGHFFNAPEAEEKFKDGMALYAEWFGALWD